MPKTFVGIKLDDHVLAIVAKYQRDHSCDRTKAVSQIIRAYPIHVMKLETKKLLGHLGENLEESTESIMPEICKHIIDFDIDKGGAKCALFHRYVSDDKCRTCPKREPVEEGNEK